MKNLKIPLLLAATFALGMAAQTFFPVAHAESGGGWQCYVVDRFPDMKAAAEWKGAVNYTTAMNTVAPNSPAGTVLMATYPVSSMGGTQVGGAPIVCSKN